MTDQSRSTITARDLLHGFLDLRRLTPDMGEWSEERLAGNPPRLFRLRRLIAMFRAFEIPWDPASFIEGKFILPEDPHYAPLLKRVAAEMPESVAHGFGPNGYQLPACFEILLRYRESVEGVLTFTSGVFEASGLFAYAYGKAGELNRIIWKHIAIIDDILVTLINPKAKMFTVHELIHDYNYPDVDLSEIDADWW